jgi:hypothetical protein
VTCDYQQESSRVAEAWACALVQTPAVLPNVGDLSSESPVIIAVCIACIRSIRVDGCAIAGGIYSVAGLSTAFRYVR